jgi:preprotein translocase subunit SecF
MWVIRNRKIFYAIAALLTCASIDALATVPLHRSVEFTGGTEIQVRYQDPKPSAEAVASAVTAAGGEEVLVRPAGEGYGVRLELLPPERHDAVMAALAVPGAGSSTVVSENTIGPSLGEELVQRMTWALALVALVIAAYVALVFRAVSKPVASWKYGVVTLVSLVHDVLLTAGAFAALGLFMDVSIDTLFVTALLVILGYSVTDTIVVFDRIRENLGRATDRERAERFDEIAGRSLRETVRRSLNTSATTAIALTVLAIFGGEVTRAFALALVLGVVSGTYSSIFLAAPLLVTWQKFAAKGAAKR